MKECCRSRDKRKEIDIQSRPLLLLYNFADLTKEANSARTIVIVTLELNLRNESRKFSGD